MARGKHAAHLAKKGISRKEKRKEPDGAAAPASKRHKSQASTSKSRLIEQQKNPDPPRRRPILAEARRQCREHAIAQYREDCAIQGTTPDPEKEKEITGKKLTASTKQALIALASELAVRTVSGAMIVAANAVNANMDTTHVFTSRKCRGESTEPIADIVAMKRRNHRLGAFLLATKVGAKKNSRLCAAYKRLNGGKGHRYLCDYDEEEIASIRAQAGVEDLPISACNHTMAASNAYNVIQTFTRRTLTDEQKEALDALDIPHKRGYHRSKSTGERIYNNPLNDDEVTRLNTAIFVLKLLMSDDVIKLDDKLRGEIHSLIPKSSCTFRGWHPYEGGAAAE
jgi:hypothetical protein